MVEKDQGYFQEGRRLWDDMGSLVVGGHSVGKLLLVER